MVDSTLFQALGSFLAVARTGSVGGAARQHHRTPSAISQQLRRLEAHFGVALVEPAGRGVRLTAVAEAMLPALGRLWQEAEAFFGEMAALSGRPAATVRVAVSDYLGKVLLVPVLRTLADERAPVRFEVVTTHSRDAIGRVARGEVEFGVVSAEPASSGLERQPLFDQAFSWVAPRPARRRREPVVARLAEEPLLRLGAESVGRRLLDDFLARARIRPRSTIDVTSVSLMLSYIAGGVGVGLAPTLALLDVSPRQVVVEPAEVPSTPVALVSRPSARRSAVSARVAEAIVAEGHRLSARLARPRPSRTVDR